MKMHMALQSILLESRCTCQYKLFCNIDDVCMSYWIGSHANAKRCNKYWIGSESRDEELCKRVVNLLKNCSVTNNLKTLLDQWQLWMCIQKFSCAQKTIALITRGRYRSNYTKCSHKFPCMGVSFLLPCCIKY